MADYPAGYAVATGSGIKQLHNTQFAFAEDGTHRGQQLDTTTRYMLTISHRALSTAAMQTLRDFYAANLDGVNIDWPDGYTYSGALTGWRQRRNGIRWDVTLEMLGDRL